MENDLKWRKKNYISKRISFKKVKVEETRKEEIYSVYNKRFFFLCDWYINLSSISGSPFCKFDNSYLYKCHYFLSNLLHFARQIYI